MRTLFRVSLFFLSLSFSSLFQPFAYAQDATGKITGTVTDQSGAAVPGAKVTVTNTSTNVAKATNADQSGNYQVLQLPIGNYSVSAQASGFQLTTVTSQTSLQINQTLRLDVQLQVGSTTSTVTVESIGSQVETENSTVGGTVIGQAIYELPLNGRNTLDLLATQPGVTRTNPDSTAAGNYSIGGMRTDSVTYLLDGGLNNNVLSNAVVANPNPDSIAEFRVIENNYSAEYGRNAGGIVSVVTKSGTNSFHGTLYDYLRNNYFDANRFFNNEQGLPTPILKRNQYGGTVGGPIKKDKLFFFFSYQGQKQIQDKTPTNGKVNTFTPAQANGDFSNSSYTSTVAAFLAANPQYQANPVLAAQGVIDPTKIDPVAKAYITKGLIPLSSSGYLFPQAGAFDNSEEYLGRFDYNITSKDVLTGTFTARDNPVSYPFQSGTTEALNVLGYTTTSSDTNYFANVSYTHTFTPNILNEFRVTAQRANHAQAIPTALQPTATQLGANVPSDNPTGAPNLYFDGSNLSTGFSPQGPTREIDNTFDYVDNLSWVLGHHSVKLGFSFAPVQNNTVYDYYINGAYFFYGPGTSVGSGVDLADFLFGLPDEFLQFGAAPSNVRSKQYGTYAQDSWKVTQRLTLNFGLRYEYAQPKFDTQGRSFSFIPGLQSQRFVNAPRGLVFPGDPGAPKGSNFPDKNDFAPRFGFAYDVTGQGKTSIRGGFGMFYDVLKAEDNLQFNGQAPFFGFGDVFPAGPGNPGPSGLQDPYGSAGAVDPFPSKPPAKNLDFAAAGFLPFGGGGVYFVDPHLRTPYVFQYNLSIQQQIAPGTTLEVGYLGYSAHKMTGLVDVNPFSPATGARLYGSDFSYLSEFQNIGKANYNAMQAHLKRAFTGMGSFGKSFLDVSYTYSHEIDNQSGFRQRNSAVPFYNHDLFRASGDTDVRNVVNISGGWDLPFDQLWSHGPKLLTKGWSLYPILSIRSGFPLDVNAGLKTRLNNPGPSGAGDAGLVRADYNGMSITTLDPSTYRTFTSESSGSTGGNFYFDPNTFSTSRLTAANTAKVGLTYYPYGTFPRNGLRGPGQTNLDLTISKHFFFTEKMNVELRGDAFNVLNHTQFSNPDTNPLSQTFGQVSNTYDPRILQLALHLQF